MSTLQTNSVYFETTNAGINYNPDGTVTLVAQTVQVNTASYINTINSLLYNKPGTYILSGNPVTPHGYIPVTNAVYQKANYPNLANAMLDINGKVAYRQFPVNWTYAAPQAKYNYTDVVYGNGVFIAFSNTSNTMQVINRSTDGYTWSNVTVTTVNSTAKSLAYGNGTWVYAGAQGTSTGAGNTLVYSSTDGLTWSNNSASVRLTAANTTGLTLAYGNGIFLGMKSGTTPVTIKSTDGASWTTANSTSWTLGSMSNISSITYGGGYFVAVNQGYYDTSVISKTTDGVTWAAGTTNEPGFNNAISHDDGVGFYRYSIRHYRTSVAYGNNVFVVSGRYDSAPCAYHLVSSLPLTGETWTGASQANVYSVTRNGGTVKYLNDQFVYLGNQCVNGAFQQTTRPSIETSTDGYSWKSKSLDSTLLFDANYVSNGGWTSIAYGNNTFVIVGSNTNGASNGRFLVGTVPSYDPVTQFVIPPYEDQYYSPINQTYFYNPDVSYGNVYVYIKT